MYEYCVYISGTVNKVIGNSDIMPGTLVLTSVKSTTREKITQILFSCRYIRVLRRSFKEPVYLIFSKHMMLVIGTRPNSECLIMI